VDDDEVRQEERWMLAHIAHHEGNGSIGLGIKTLEPVDIEAINEDVGHVRTYLINRNLVRMVQVNLSELCESVAEAAVAFSQTRNIHAVELDGVAFDLGRLLLNTLSSFRTLLDHTDTALSRDFGKQSDQWSKWKATVASEYDVHWQYRFMYQLRNFTQHVGMPPLHVSFSAASDEEHVGMRLDLSRVTLLDHPDVWNRKVADDLAAQPEAIPFIDCLNVWSECFWRISRVLLDIWLEAAAEHAKRIVGHRLRFGLGDDDGRLCAVLIDATSEPVTLRFVELEEATARMLAVGKHLEL
jgi:hypothetical protein